MNANSEIARRWMHEVWNERRRETIHELLHPDAKGWLEGRTVIGPEEFEQAWLGLTGAFPDLRITLESLVAEGDEAVVRWSVAGSHRGDHLGIAATLQPVAFRGMTWFVIRDGQIVEGWDSWNLGGLLQTLAQGTAPA